MASTLLPDIIIEWTALTLNQMLAAHLVEEQLNLSIHGLYSIKSNQILAIHLPKHDQAMLFSQKIANKCDVGFDWYHT